MARTRKPTALLELAGAFDKNPQRRRSRENEPKPLPNVGEPPAYLELHEKSAWLDLVSMSAPGVLTFADRPLLELSARLYARMRRDGIGGRAGLQVGEMAQFKDCLIRMAMTPADRSKVHVSHDELEENPFAALAAATKPKPQAEGGPKPKPN